MLTSIVQGISMLLELDASICAITKQRRIAWIVLYRCGVQLRSPRKVMAFSDTVVQFSK